MSSPSTPLRTVQTSSIGAPQKATTNNARKRENDGSPETSPIRGQDQSKVSKNAQKKCRREATRCVCGNVRCKDLMKRLQDINKSDRGHFQNVPLYLDVPKPPKVNPNRRTKLRPEEVVTRDDKQKKHQRTYEVLGAAAKERVNAFFKPTEESIELFGSKVKSLQFAIIHLHPRILKFMADENNGKLPAFIPRALGNELSKEGLCQFRDNDIVPSSMSKEKNYVPLPNYPVGRAEQDLDTLVKNASNRKKAEEALETSNLPSLLTRSGAAVTLNPERFEVEQIRSEYEAKALHLNKREKELLAREKECQETKNRTEKMLLEREMNLHKREEELNENLKQVADILAGGHGGLSRLTLTSKDWHKKNTTAATALFGFTSWKETVCYIHALFDLYPPTTQPTAKQHISAFEWCLAAKLRMNCGMSYRCIAYILGLKAENHVGDKVKQWVYEWGEAGLDLSILDITPEFLVSTCPQAYLDEEELEKIGGIPDGKDFKIYTPRKNTLFTRACYSDKVHASAVRCISWCTPMGLSYEHTHLFLARVSEKALVELWGPRLKKCPKGYAMLSDRGFWDTARFYPNMNRQLTPKFLSGRDQFTAEEVSADRTICKLRYTCEVAFSRVTDTSALQDVISHDFFVMLDAMNHWGHANVNIKRPLLPLGR